jgi:hypothetical protein
MNAESGMRNAGKEYRLQMWIMTGNSLGWSHAIFVKLRQEFIDTFWLPYASKSTSFLV